MLQRDYVMRLLQEFFAALALALSKKEYASRREALRRLFDQYLGGYGRWHQVALDEVMEALARYPAEQRLSRAEMLAELYAAEAMLTTGPEGRGLADKALFLYRLVDREGRTFSLDRMRKMSVLRTRLSALED